MLILSNTIRRVFADRYRVIPSDGTDDPKGFSIQIDLELNRNKDLEKKAKFFEINFYSPRDSSQRDASTFERLFPNRYFKNTGNLKKYSNNNNDLNATFKSDIRKNIFIDYNTKFLEKEGTQLKDLITFKSSDFWSSKSPVYRLTLSSSISSFIKTRKNNGNPFTNFRIFILNEEKSIIAKTDFLPIDFSENTLNKKLDLGKDFNLNKVHIDNLLEKLNKTHFIFNNDYINIHNPENLRYDFSIDHFKLVYIAGDDNRFEYSSNDINLNSDVFGFQYLGNNSQLEAITKKISKNVLEDKKSFPIQIIVYKDNYEKSKTINFDRDDPFIRKCFDIKKGIVSTEIFDKIKNDIIKITSNQNTLNLRLLDIDETDTILSKLFIRKIYKNSIDKEIDYLYNSANFNVSNRTDYKSLNYNQLKNINFKTNINFYDNKIFFEFKIKDTYLEIPNHTKTLETQIPQSINVNNDNSAIAVLNNFISQNIKYENIVMNRPVINTNSSIFTYDRVILRNINELNSIAYNLGYELQEDNSSGDVKKYLKECIFQIENETRVGLNQRGRTTKTKYFFGHQLFDFTSFENNFITFKENILETIYSEDLSILDIEPGVKNFFSKTEDIEAYYSLLLIENNIVIKNSLSVKAFCFPDIMTKFLYPKTELGGKIEIKSGVNHTDVQENLLNVTTNNYLSKITQNIDNINSLKEVMFSSKNRDEDDNISSNDFSVFFEILNNKFSKTTTYNQQHSINKNQILSLLNIENSLPSFILNQQSDFEETFTDLSVDNSNFIDYIDFPITCSFIDTKYNSRLDAFNFNYLNYLNDYTKNIKIDIQKVSGFFDEIKSISNIKTSIHYLFSDSKRELNSSFSNDTDVSFKVVSYKGKKYGTYSQKFLQENINTFKSFSNGLMSEGYVIDNNTISFNNINQKDILLDSLKHGKKAEFISSVIYNDKSLKFLHKIILRSFIDFTVVLKNSSGSEKTVSFYFNHEIKPINLVNQYRVITNNINIINENP